MTEPAEHLACSFASTGPTGNTTAYVIDRNGKRLHQELAHSAEVFQVAARTRPMPSIRHECSVNESRP